MLHLGAARNWDPPVLMATAAEGEGVDEVWAAVREHRDRAETSGALAAKRRARLLREAESLAAERFRIRAAEALEQDPTLGDDLAERRIDPYAAAQELLRRAGAH
jgi:LAO/AO transport system kinase